jgi:hypothetical protein
MEEGTEMNSIQLISGRSVVIDDIKQVESALSHALSTDAPFLAVDSGGDIVKIRLDQIECIRYEGRENKK